MFDSITKNFGGVIDKLRGKKYISEDDFNQALREIRIAMIEADVSLPIIKEFIKNIKDKVVGEEVIGDNCASTCGDTEGGVHKGLGDTG